MQTVILAVVVAFAGFFAVLTVTVAVNYGFDVLTVLALLILALIGFGAIGALLNRPPDDR